MTVERMPTASAHHGEGPVWFPEEGVLRWVDMLAGDILTWDPDTDTSSRLHVAPVVAAIRPRTRGGLVIAVERGFALLDNDSGTPRFLPSVWSDPTVRMNDGACDALGRFYCGSMAYDATPGRGALYRLDPDGNVSRILSDVTISNGLAWDERGELAYYIDSAAHRVDVFDVEPDSGRLVERRTVVSIPPDIGTPDGLCLDTDDGLWVALWDGAAVHRYTTNGQLDVRVELPVTRPTACTFGGTDLDELYITSSREGLPPDPHTEPEAGSILRIVPGTRGLPTQAFAG